MLNKTVSSIKNEVIIVIPLYKASLSAEEKESLLQVFSILENYSICLFTYRQLDLTQYKTLLQGKTYTTAFFDSKYFMDISGYSLLMLSKKFYQRFLEYKFLLVYQLDAWVFFDDLKYWCKQDYDYIGAPWFDNWNTVNPSSVFCGVGNGGFSLRKVKSHIKTLNSFSYVQPASQLISAFFDRKPSLKSLKLLAQGLTVKNNTFYKFNDYKENEDRFWGIVATEKFRWFNTPDMVTAAKFSLEIKAEFLFNLTDHQMPFGCHALSKYAPFFFEQLKAISRASMCNTVK